ncbi:MAG TPA: tetratricopeptide repeat protein [Arenibaculum sp.]|nr:tetratricopeptide repeat protein [Arenibaculum sp.]
MIKTTSALLLAALLVVPGLIAGANRVVAADTAADKAVDTVAGTAAWTASGSYLAGLHAQQSNDWSAASRLMETVLAFDPENPDLLRRAWLLDLGAGRTGRAVDIVRDIAEADRGSHLAVVLLIADHVRGGRLEEAAGLLADRLPADGLSQYVEPLVRAWVQAGLGRKDEAIEALGALASSPGFMPLHDLHVGLISELAGERREAGAAFAKAGEAGASLRVVQIVGGFLERDGRPDEARRLYETFREGASDALLIEPAIAGLDDGRPAELVVRDAREGLAEALFDLASALHQEGADDLALLYGRISLHLRDDLPLARLMIGDILARAGRHEEAIAEYRAIEGEPGLRWAARLRIAERLERLERTGEAVDLLEAMGEERPERFDALLSLGDLHRAAERFEPAVAAYDGAIERIGDVTPRHWLLFYSRGVSFERSGQWQRAEADLLKALDLNPDQPQLLNYLGYSWVDRGLNLDRARGMIERAVALRPNDGYIVDSLGWVLYRLGDYDEAVVHLERAVELTPLDPTINDHLGDAYWQVGRRHEARFQWQRALHQAEKADEKEKIRAKLSDGLPLRQTAADTTTAD